MLEGTISAELSHIIASGLHEHGTWGPYSVCVYLKLYALIALIEDFSVFFFFFFWTIASLDFNLFVLDGLGLLIIHLPGLLVDNTSCKYLK